MLTNNALLNRKHHSSIFLIIASVVLAVVVVAYGHADIKLPIVEKIRHKRIAKRHSDTISACLFYHAADYFIYQGSVIGFQHDILRQMEKDFGRPVSITIETDPDTMLVTAMSDEYDIVCYDFDKTNFSGTYIIESEPLSYTYPVLITRKHSKDDTLRENVVNTSAKYYNKLDFSEMENPEEWSVKHNPRHAVEDLMEMLVDRQIDYAVCNYNVAVTLMPFYSQLAAGPKIGDSFPRTWILNKNNKSLNDSINNWIADFKETTKYQSLCKKYLSPNSYVISRSFGKQKYSTSQYDPLLKKVAGHFGFDWHFISSIIYQESKFIPDLIGFGGSFGIMQMMPVTGERYGISDTSSVEDQIWAGGKYISFLCNIFKDKVDTSQLYYFVSGSYNSGPGHILDAMALCEKYGHDKTQWDQVVEYLILKSHKDYYNDEVVKCGYYPGKHTANYVEQVMTRYYGYILNEQK